MNGINTYEDYNEYGYMSVEDSNRFIRKAFLHSIGGVLLSCVVAVYLLFFNYRLFSSIFDKFYIIVLAQLGLAFIFGLFLQKLSIAATTFLYYMYAAFTGVTFAVIGMMYTGVSILIALAVTLTLFILLAVYGFTTKEDLSGYGKYLRVALLTIIIFSIINFFLKLSLIYWGITFVAIVVFSGLIAYDVNRIKKLSTELIYDDPSMKNKLSIMMAFNLYLDFVNLFIYILRILGKRK
ncbi:Bax inhibitor-1/YccA family protein [Fusobacterium sp. PH5-44]|uniref:Bax inhibitor-1/YccA family protein n=1 Tax=unclassified Fusobacterium TaxID=2648384 RepID=UPI003D241518